MEAAWTALMQAVPAYAQGPPHAILTRTGRS
jgi:hypothetical protein